MGDAETRFRLVVDKYDPCGPVHVLPLSVDFEEGRVAHRLETTLNRMFQEGPREPWQYDAIIRNLGNPRYQALCHARYMERKRILWRVLEMELEPIPRLTFA